MIDNSYEGSLVLERMSEHGLLDNFYAAIDADDFSQAQALMLEAGLDAQTIATVLQKMQDADGNH